MVSDQSVHPTPVVFGFDAKFACYSAVAIASLLAHSDCPLNINCIVQSLDQDSIANIRRVVARTKSTVTFHEVDPGLFSTWKTQFHFSAANYYRIMAPYLLEGSRALYLDSDLIVTCDIQPLLDTDLHGNWIGGCVDERGGRFADIPRPPDEPYVNSGVLLLDLDALRAHDWLGQAGAVLAESEPLIKFADQCVINKVAEGKKSILDKRWNVLVGNYGLSHLEKQLSGFDRRAIFHANGEIKPWMKWCDPWFARLWSSYARLVDMPADKRLIEPKTVRELTIYAAVLGDNRRWEEVVAVKDRLLELHGYRFRRRLS